MRLHRVALLLFLSAAVVAPVALSAQGRGGGQAVGRPAYDEGFRRGLTFGERDGRDRRALNFGIIVDYRNGDVGWRAEFGSRDRYRDDFRVGFEAGYRDGYGRHGVIQQSGPPYGWARGRGANRGNDLAWSNGFRDGYEEGLNDGRRRHRNDPGDESRYRNGDRGYERWYGDKNRYRANYRDAFWQGYEEGYRDGLRYR